MPVDDVSDPTDWLPTPLSGLAAVEAALRCQVCKDFFKTPMITSCSHTFCSICIRRALSNDGKCPLCRAPEQELKLRSNWTVEEAVEAFCKARPAILALARDPLSASSVIKRKADVDEPPDPHPKRLRTSARLNKTRAGATTPVQSQEEDVEPSNDDEYFPDDDDGLVPCPACQRRMKAWQVFQHLETCPGPSTQKESRRKDSKMSSSGQAPKRPVKLPERLPALNYSMLKEQALRKKMAELGISNQGSRALLEKRHKEWLTLWNANCDATQPKTRSELLRDLESWERTQGGRVPMPSTMSQAAVKDKEFDTAAWAAKHSSSFKDLIANARKSRLEATMRAEGSRMPLDEQTDLSIRTVTGLAQSSSPLSLSEPMEDDGNGRVRDTGLNEPALDGESTSPCGSTLNQ